jgi:hypothetical protein
VGTLIVHVPPVFGFIPNACGGIGVPASLSRVVAVVVTENVTVTESPGASVASTGVVNHET